MTAGFEEGGDMKTYGLSLLSGLAILFVALGGSAAAESAVRALDLCSLISTTSSFDYAKYFDEEFRKRVPYENLVAHFRGIAQANGGCLSVEPLKSTYSMASEADYVLNTANGKRIAVSIEISATTGKFLKFSSSGNILSPNKLSFDDKRVRMRDGTSLRTIVFRPTGATGNLPTVLHRTPYFYMGDKFDMLSFATASYYVDRGYAYVYQAIRGTGGSEGEVRFMHPIEASDGADTIGWIRQQPFSNQRVATVGTSYDGFTAIAAGVENPAGLKLIMTGAGPVEARTMGKLPYSLLNTGFLDYIKYLQTGKGVPFTDCILREMLLSKASRELDARKYDELVYGMKIPEWKRFANAFSNSKHSYWSERSLLGRLPGISTPTWFIAGLASDGSIQQTVDNFNQIEKHSPYRSSHHLILGNWDHGDNTPVGDGSNIKPFVAERFDSVLAHYLKDEPSPYVSEPRVQVQSHQGDDRFLQGDHYPLPGLEKQTLFLSPVSSAPGFLDLTEKPYSGEKKPFSSYTSDPSTAVPDPDDLSQALAFGYTAPRDLFLNGSLGFRLYLKIDVPVATYFSNSQA